MRYTILAIVIAFSLLIIWINVSLYSVNDTFSECKADIVCQLNFLEAELKNHDLGMRMQQVFPEGFVFVNALYGLAWCEFALSDHSLSSEQKERAISEALFAYNEINSENAKMTFDRDLKPECGVFYFGWKNYLRSKILAVDTTFLGHDDIVSAFKVECDTFIDAVKNNEGPYLQSYSGMSWPADMVMAMASISNHDKIFVPKYRADIKEWLGNVKNRLDRDTKMIPHCVDAISGVPIQGPRGCSMSLMLRVLDEIDTTLAHGQYNLFKTNFVSKTLGLPSVSEYPNGKFGWGDIDSGPVILGVGFAGTIVSIGTYACFGDVEAAENQYKTIHAFGLSFTHQKKKCYLGGMLPIADAFIVWGRATGLKNYNVIADSNSVKWFVTFHIISLGIILVVWGIYFHKLLIRFVKERQKNFIKF